jgi:U3 small nucleolar RNA-associated protein 13
MSLFDLASFHPPHSILLAFSHAYRVHQPRPPLFLQLSSKSDAMFLSCEDKVNVVEASTGKLLRTLDGDTEPIMSLAISPDDTMLVASSRSRMTRVFDWQTGELIRAFKAHEGPVLTMDFDSTSTLLATGSADATVKVWDVHKGFCTHNFKGSSGIVTTVQFHPEKLELFSCAADGHIRWWDLKTSKSLGVLEGHNSVVRGLAFVGKSTLISGGRDQVVLVWDLKAKKTIKTSVLMESVESVVLLPTGAEFPGQPEEGETDDIAFYVTAGDKNELRIWGYPSGKCYHTERAPAKLNTLVLDDRSGQLIATTVDSTILFYDPFSMKRTRQVIGSYDEVLDLKYIGAAASHVAVATNTDNIQLLDPKTLDTAILEGHSDIVLALDVSADGLTMISGSKDNTLRVWNAGADGVWGCVALGRGHAGNVGAVALPRKKVTFAISTSKDCTMKLWNLPIPLPAKTGPNSEPLALSSKYTRRAHEKEINCATVAPNDKLIMTGSQDKTCKVWRAADGEQMGVLKGHKRGVWCCVFSPVDQVAATSSADATVKLWALADFTCVKTFEGHEGSVLRVSFLTRGTQLLSAGSDGLLKLWNIRNNEMIKTLDGHEGRVWAMAVSRDETSVISGAQDGTIAIWHDSTVEESDAKLADEERDVIMAQDLRNLVRDHKYSEAAELAMELKQPYQLLQIINAILKQKRAVVKLANLVRPMTLARVGQLLEYTRDWNTNSRNVAPAQAVLTAVLTTNTISELAGAPGVGTSVASLIAYSERHYKRITKLQQQSRLVDFAWATMKPGGGDGLDEAEALMQAMPLHAAIKPVRWADVKYDDPEAGEHEIFDAPDSDSDEEEVAAAAAEEEDAAPLDIEDEADADAADDAMEVASSEPNAEDDTDVAAAFAATESEEPPAVDEKKNSKKSKKKSKKEKTEDVEAKVEDTPKKEKKKSKKDKKRKEEVSDADAEQPVEAPTPSRRSKRVKKGDADA